MSNFKISRRKFISSSGVVLTLPLLEALVPVNAMAQAVDPRRAVFLYMPNGTWNKTNDAPWYPATGKLTTTLPDVLSPFPTYIGDYSVLKSLKYGARDATDGNYYKFNGNGGGHVSAVSSYLSQQVITTPASTTCSIARPSVDQVIAQKAQLKTLTLHIGGLTSGADNSPFDYSNYISFANGQAVQPITNPLDLYRSLLGQVSSATPAIAAQLSGKSKKSILDFVVADLASLRNSLGKNDRVKLDSFTTSVRSLETTLASTAKGGVCSAAPSPASTLDNYGGENVQDYFPRVRAYFDMIAFAFSCDLARSASFMFDGEVGERILNAQIPASLVYSSASLTDGMHIGIAHNGGRTHNITKDRAYMSLLLYLVDKLRSLSDASGSPILDNTAILMGYGVYQGDHGANGDGTSPNVLAGGRNFLSPGNSYDLSAKDIKDVLFTIASKLNLGITSFEGASTVLSL